MAITLLLGDIPVIIPAELFADAIKTQLPAILRGDGGGEMSGKEKAARFAIKALMREMLELIGKQLDRANSPLPRPARPKGVDPLEYGANYLLYLVFAMLESQEWPLECVETADAIQIVGLGKLAAPAALPAPSEPEEGEPGEGAELAS